MRISNKVKLLSALVSPKLAKNAAFRKYDSLTYGDDLPSGWHEYELLMLEQLLEKDSVFLDVGTNLGTYVYKALQHTNSENIHAFEPLREYNKFLGRIFPEITLSELALSDQRDTRTISVPLHQNIENYSRASISAYESVEDGSSRDLYSVKTDTVDNYVLGKKLSSVDLIKIDVEGHEKSVLNGAEKTMRQFMPTLIVEIETRYVDAPDEILHALKDIGYECLYIDGESRTLEVLDESIKSIQVAADLGADNYINNFIFVEKSKVQQLCERVNSLVKNQ